MGNTVKNLLVWLVLALVLILAFNALQGTKETKQQIEYSLFMQDVKAGKVDQVNIEGSVARGYEIQGVRKDKTTFSTNAPLDEQLVPSLLQNDVRVKVTPEEKPSMLGSILLSLLPILLLIGVWFYFMRQMQGGGGGKGGAFSFGKSRAKLLDKDTNAITFADVAGCDEAKEEVQEIVDYLKAPSRYQSLGGRVPRGVLLAGSPGTGKTLLAKAIAGEAKVPFYSISGSDFVEMFVGVGASRVRDMFEQAKKNSPSIIFIDEIDAVGRQRGAGLGGGNDEREQTLNQLLVEMDGFESNQTVIVIAATNRPDVLDPALQRPGRFDRHVTVDRPDIKGREEILKVHIKGKPVSPTVDLRVLAQQTAGFTGADLSNLVNEAALLSAREGKNMIEMPQMQEAIERVIAGPERRSKVLSDSTKKLTAFHEAGHAITAHYLPAADKVHKITIIPRGRAGGYTLTLPKEDRSYMTKQEMIDEIKVLMGGRVAEALVLKDISTGASNDLERASETARRMVCDYGMSEKLGPISFGSRQEQVFLGRDMGRDRNYSEEVAQIIDQEVRRIVEDAYQKTEEILTTHMDELHTIANALLEFETIDSVDMKYLLADGRMPTAEEKKEAEIAAAHRATSDEPVIEEAPVVEEEPVTAAPPLSEV